MRYALCLSSVLALVLGVAILWSSPPDRLAGRASGRESTSDLIARPESATIGVQRVDVRGGQRLRIVDDLSGQPLAGVDVRAGDASGTSDAEGRATLSVRDTQPDPITVQFATGGEFPALRFSRRLSSRSDTEVEVRLPVFSGVTVRFVGTDVAAARGTLLLRPRCELQALSNLDDGTVRSLRLTESQPAMLEERLVELGHPLPAGKAVVPFELRRGELWETVVFSAHEGAADISVRGVMTVLGRSRESASALRNASRPVVLERGRPTQVVLELAAKPWIRGRLVDEDRRPLAGVDVTVASRSAFDSREAIPHEPAEPGSAAVVLMRRRGESDVTGLLQLTRRTDERGEFAIPLSFTDRVAAWAYPQGRELAYREVRAAHRFADVGDLVLVARSSSGASRRVSLMDSTGDPIGGVRVQLIQMTGDNRFQRHPPVQVSAMDGELDLSRCLAGERYVLRFPDGDFRLTDLPRDAPHVLVQPSRP